MTFEGAERSICFWPKFLVRKQIRRCARNYSARTFVAGEES